MQTIAARIVKNRDTLKQYGIEVEKSNGQLKSTFEILQELKPIWDKMNETERVTLGDTLAGTNQFKVNKNAFDRLYRLKFGDEQDRAKTFYKSMRRDCGIYMVTYILKSILDYSSNIQSELVI